MNGRLSVGATCGGAIAECVYCLKDVKDAGNVLWYVEPEGAVAQLVMHPDCMVSLANEMQSRALLTKQGIGVSAKDVQPSR